VVKSHCNTILESIGSARRNEKTTNSEGIENSRISACKTIYSCTRKE